MIPGGVFAHSCHQIAQMTAVHADFTRIPLLFPSQLPAYEYFRINTIHLHIFRVGKGFSWCVCKHTGDDRQAS